MGMLLYTFNTKTEPESDPPILVLHTLPLFQFFIKQYDILEVPQVVFICLEMNEIPWCSVEVFKMRTINIISMKNILPIEPYIETLLGFSTSWRYICKLLQITEETVRKLSKNIFFALFPACVLSGPFCVLSGHLVMMYMIL